MRRDTWYERQVGCGFESCVGVQISFLLVHSLGKSSNLGHAQCQRIEYTSQQFLKLPTTQGLLQLWWGECSSLSTI